ncbi:type VI secretion protein [Streptomyces sp. TR02-1]|uniref:type VI secretion protein n=1 Tax=Streptomyces sp. TR02-1 TaxID=3385977 RepID=UPI0039A04551
MTPYERGSGGDRWGTGGERREGNRGVPDGMLVGALALVLAAAGLVWSATGLSALLGHGHWPDGLSFSRTPLALRHLATDPRDVAGAWPDVPAGQLSGLGLFWGVFIGQLMVLLVLAVFVIGTVTRGRAVRASRREKQNATLDSGPSGTGTPAGAPAVGPDAAGPGAGPPAAGPSPREKDFHEADEARQPPQRPETASPGLLPPVPPVVLPQHNARTHADPPSGIPPQPSTPSSSGLLVAPEDGAVAEAAHAAPGPLVVVTANPGLWSRTAAARAERGPVHVYDPEQRTDCPVRLRWAPHHGCADMATARTRAAALLAPVRRPAMSEEAVHDTARTLLRCWLHAAAVAREPFRQVHRWALGGSCKDAVRVLRTDPGATAGAAGELEAALTGHPERREAATERIRRALTCLSTLHVRNACTASRTDRLAWESFAPEGGSLYIVGASVEAPYRGDPGVTPLLTALTSAVVGHGRRMAARSSSGRLDPPITLVLDQPATVAPLPELPSLLAEGEEAGLVTHAVVRSEEQLRTWWPGLADRMH